jgi:hypothetical protein
MDALRASTAFLPTIGIHHRRDDRANQADRANCDLYWRARSAARGGLRAVEIIRVKRKGRPEAALAFS